MFLKFATSYNEILEKIDQIDPVNYGEPGIILMELLLVCRHTFQGEL